METKKSYMLKNYKWLQITCGILIALMVLLMGVTGLITRYYMKNNLICYGITIAGQDVSKMNKQEIFQFLEDTEKKLNQKSIVLQYGGKSWPFKLQEKSIFLDKNKTFSQAYWVGRKGKPWEQAITILKTRYRGKNIPLYFYVSSPEMKQYLDQIGKVIYVKPHNAVLQANPDRTVKVIPETVGIQLDVEKTLTKLQQVLANPHNGIYASIEIRKKIPDFTRTYIDRLGLKNLISSYTTAFNPAKKNRSDNIKIAAEALHGTVLKPGDIFSFNERVGPRDGKNGYKNAPIIENGNLVDGIGGGVCQVSSTLYNAVLYADLEVVSRSNHTLPSTYVGLGRDATVDFGSLDFKFKNNTNQNLYITTHVAGGHLTINLFGESFNKQVRIFTTDEKTIQPKVEKHKDYSLPKGKQKVERASKPGYQVTVWRLVEQNHKEIKREIISKDYYAPVSGIVSIGAGNVSQPEKKDNSTKDEPAVTREDHIQMNDEKYEDMDEAPVIIDEHIDILQ